MVKCPHPHGLQSKVTDTQRVGLSVVVGAVTQGGGLRHLHRYLAGGSLQLLLMSLTNKIIFILE